MQARGEKHEFIHTLYFSFNHSTNSSLYSLSPFFPFTVIPSFPGFCSCSLLLFLHKTSYWFEDDLHTQDVQVKVLKTSALEVRVSDTTKKWAVNFTAYFTVLYFSWWKKVICWKLTSLKFVVIFYLIFDIKMYKMSRLKNVIKKHVFM